MARGLLYECFSGISGDMHIGALIDIGVPHEYFCQELDRLHLGSEFQLTAKRGSKMGITGTHASVVVDTSNEPEHRHLPTILNMIDAAHYSDHVTKLATDIFTNIAVAEGAIHGIEPDQVHFHEVGATDSIVDIVSAAIGIDYLDPSLVYCGVVELGSGTVRCAHGVMPVPAPATAEILKGIPTSRGRVSSEATTPTGAAILKTVVDDFETPAIFSTTDIGYGIGVKDFEVPNVLRLSLGEIDTTLESETNLEIECNIDDMNPEAYQPLMDALFLAGAKDVFFTPMIMKKSRPGTRVSVLVAPADKDPVISQLFAGSTTLGVRIHPVTKHMLPREERVLETSLGSVRVKISRMPDGGIRWKSEHDDIQTLATKHQQDYLATKRHVDADIERQLAS
ncbi:nickel pincer cofactor biosynthesis protein LarC [Gammaproteobacteria bacterium]|nr:nickel pincer cofactor biosynthesis protein LarC [Gammaproteobacteria bacterium]